MATWNPNTPDYNWAGYGGVDLSLTWTYPDYGIFAMPPIPKLWWAGNEYLDSDAKQKNAVFIRDWLLTDGWAYKSPIKREFNGMTDAPWSKLSIYAFLGNCELESTLSPALWEGKDFQNPGKGYGLCQWTHRAGPNPLVSWAAEYGLRDYDICVQLGRLMYEYAEGIEWRSDGNLRNAAEFWYANEDVYDLDYLTYAFMYCYLRPSSYDTLAERQSKAKKWQTYLEKIPYSDPRKEWKKTTTSKWIFTYMRPWWKKGGMIK